MTVETTIKKVMEELESLCASYENTSLQKLEDFEETVVHLSYEVRRLDLASDQTLKKELNTLQNTLSKLSFILNEQKQNLEQRVQQICLHQRALYAYACVANNNPYVS